MIGRDCSTQSLGVAPTAISWLFKVMEDRREKSGAGFSVRASAVEISGREEALTDLLADQQGVLTHLQADLACSSAGGQQGAVTLREDPLCGSQVRRNTPSSSSVIITIISMVFHCTAFHILLLLLATQCPLSGVAKRLDFKTPFQLESP